MTDLEPLAGEHVGVSDEVGLDQFFEFVMGRPERARREVVVGRITVEDDGSLIIRHDSNDESSLRTALAKYATVHGWDVREEVVIPNWGRLDLMLEATGTSFAVELKLDISKPAKGRKAFQQAAGYHRWLRSEDNDAIVVLAAPEVDGAHLDALRLLYGEVLCLSVSELMTCIAGDRASFDARRLTMLERLKEASTRVSEIEAAFRRDDES